MKEVIVFFVGIAVGAVNSVGGGGMLLGFPVLLAIGVPAIIANATGKLVVLPGQISSAFGYRRFLPTIPKRYYLLIIPGAIGGVAGALLLERTSVVQFEGLVPYLVLAAVALFAFEPILQKRLEGRKHRKIVLPLPYMFVLMLVSSVYAGYFGVGFGFLMLSFLSFSSLRNIHQMNLIKNICGGFAVIFTIVALLHGSLINWKFGIVMAAGNGIGGYMMARSAPKVPPALIRGVDISFGLATALYFLLYK